MIVFELSMPQVGSWNGEWTGSKNYYAIVRNLGRTKVAKAKEALLDGSSFYHNFGDGWGMSIKVRKITAQEATKIRKQSNGFYGYEWAVDSILRYGKIKA